MLPLSRLIIRFALPKTLTLIYRVTVSTGVAAAIHHQTLYSLSLVLFRSLRYGVQFLNISFIHDLLPKNFKIDLKVLRKVIISAVIAKLFKYTALATFWIPFRGAIFEILLNELAGNSSSVKSILGVLNHITIPWLQELNDILVWTINHVQPISEWNISIAWIPVIISLTSLASYFYWYPDTDFSRDMLLIFGSVWRLFNIVTFGVPSKVLGVFNWTFTRTISLFTFTFDKLKSLCRWLGGTSNGMGVPGNIALDEEIPELPDTTTTGT